VEGLSLHTTQMQIWLDRFRRGDRAAADELLRASGAGLERLTRRMLRRFPNVRRWVDAGDVLQNASLRLLRSLREVQPESTRAFLGLAAAHIRRELLDLARHYYGREGPASHHVSPPPVEWECVPDVGSEEARELARWCAFHEAVERLPAEEREVFGLAFYHGWTRPDIAALYQVSARTVRRWWRSACQRLSEELGGELPGA
jgi:RNA polymerase sigma-70 factor (ECF subfamily)